MARSMPSSNNEENKNGGPDRPRSSSSTSEQNTSPSPQPAQSRPAIAGSPGFVPSVNPHSLPGMLADLARSGGATAPMLPSLSRFDCRSSLVLHPNAHRLHMNTHSWLYARAIAERFELTSMITFEHGHDAAPWPFNFYRTDQAEGRWLFNGGHLNFEVTRLTRRPYDPNMRLCGEQGANIFADRHGLRDRRMGLALDNTAPHDGLCAVGGGASSSSSSSGERPPRQKRPAADDKNDGVDGDGLDESFADDEGFAEAFDIRRPAAKRPRISPASNNSLRDARPLQAQPQSQLSGYHTPGSTWTPSSSPISPLTSPASPPLAAPDLWRASHDDHGDHDDAIFAAEEEARGPAAEGVRAEGAAGESEGPRPNFDVPHSIRGPLRSPLTYIRCGDPPSGVEPSPYTRQDRVRAVVEEDRKIAYAWDMAAMQIRDQKKLPKPS